LTDLILSEDLKKRYSSTTFAEKLQKATSGVEEEAELNRILGKSVKGRWFVLHGVIFQDYQTFQKQ
jgi:hypothetical protein